MVTISNGEVMAVMDKVDTCRLFQMDQYAIDMQIVVPNHHEALGWKGVYIVLQSYMSTSIEATQHGSAYPVAGRCSRGTIETLFKSAFVKKYGIS